MIKTGIYLYEGITAELLRMLRKHPDVEIKWIASRKADRLSKNFDNLLDTGDAEIVEWTDDSPDLSEIDLYIGSDNRRIRELYETDSDIKIIFPEALDDSHGFDEILGVSEYNRKAMVRGGRVAVLPDVPTLLGALALMPLAKNLMLNSPVTGIMVIPEHHKTFRTPSPYDQANFTVIPAGSKRNEACAQGYNFDVLREKILAPMQTSMKSTLEINVIETAASDFACAVLCSDVKITGEQAREIFNDFYSDHRHVFFPATPITDRMVRGSNSTAIHLSNDSMGRLIITVAFDARFKGGAGNIVHIMNLLFGLDERTGF